MAAEAARFWPSALNSMASIDDIGRGSDSHGQFLLAVSCAGDEQRKRCEFE